MTRDQYVQLLKNLLPRGPAWSHEPGTFLEKLFKAWAEEMVRLDVRVGTDLVNEADPNTALELLSDWERVVRIPDDCQTSVASDIGQRQRDVVRKLTFRGGQSRQFFIDLAAAFGYTITISEIRPFRCGRETSGDRCYGFDWQHHWLVHSPSQISRIFLCGQGHSGERLRDWSNVLLECIIQDAKPAHTTVHFAYGG